MMPADLTLDAAIIGGGPAGSAAALSLRQVMPAAVIGIFDAGTTRGWRPGEILPPGAAPILQSLGCWPAFQASGFVESFGTHAAWGSPDCHDHDFMFSLRGSGWRLDRARFDDLLRQRAHAAGVAIHLSAPLLSSTADAAGWHLRFGGFDAHARFVIDASGRSAAFAVQRGARRVPHDRLAGVVVLMETVDGGDTLVEATEHGWWYSAAVPGSTTVAAFMTDTDLIRESRGYLPERWHERLAGSTHTRQRLRSAIPKGPPAVFAAHSQRLSLTSGRGWVAAGDAAMTFDPLSSRGILKALRTGKLASFVAADFLRGGVESHRRYERLAAIEYEAYETARREYYAMEQRWPDATFWKRRHETLRAGTAHRVIPPTGFRRA